MYRFLIIDDEPLVREGISNTIDWNAHGFELVGACRDGREGLRALEQLRPDVVLTDICMPFVDGLELAASISDQYPGTRTILLTGYDEFEYAQEAVKLNVRDFLLKPITADELRQVLESLREELDEEQDRRRNMELLQEQLKESLPVFRERFLNNLVRSTILPDDAARKIALLRLDLPGPAYITLLCDRDHDDAPDDLSGIAVQNAIASVVGSVSGCLSFSIPDDKTVILLSVEDSDAALSRALELAETVSEQIKRSLNRTVSLGIGDAVDTVYDLPRSYRTARTALEQRLLLGPDQVVTIQQVRGIPSTSTLPDNADKRRGLVHALRTGSTREAMTALKDLLAVFRDGQDAEYCHVTMHRVLADALNALDSIEIDYRAIPGFQSNPFDQLARMKTIEEIERWFTRFIEETRTLLDNRRRQHSQRKAIAAEAFIRENYARPDLSLREVCKALAVSKSYLSPIFKAHTGMTFVECLTETRMRQAEALLNRTDLKVYEIAEQVGFRDSHYFSLTFRKQTGLSPSEYREQCWGGGA